MYDNLQVLLDIFFLETQGIDIGKQAVISIILAIIVFVPAIILSKKRSVNIERFIMGYVFLLYISFVLTLTILRRPVGSRQGIVHLFINLGFGLKTGKPSVRVSAYSIYNILLFIPFGFFSYLVFRNKAKSTRILFSTIVGMCFSLIIEITQLITGRGMFELTDLLTNTTGSLIGAIMALFIHLLVYKNRYGVKNESINGK